MELFLPSILVLVLAAVVVFLILPKLSPYILGGMAIILLIFGVVQHYQTFPFEYSWSNIQFMVEDYAPFVIIAALILGLIITIGNMFGFSAPSVTSILPEMPAVGSNNGSNKGGLVNGVMNTLGLNANRPANNKGGLVNGVMNTLGLGGNAKKNNGGGLLGNRFTTV